MVSTQKYLAFDIGGSGGRAVIGDFDGERLTLEDINTVRNDFVRMNRFFYSNFPLLMHGIYESIRKAHRLCSGNVAGIGVDTTGVSFGFLDGNGELLANPLYTRTPQKREVVSRIFEVIDPEELYGLTGLQVTKLNSLYHLMALKLAGSPIPDAASQILMLPDLINYILTGEIVGEYTISSTSHLLNVHSKRWDHSLIERVGLRPEIFPEVLLPGRIIGKLSSATLEETGANNTPVMAIASHDTASALAFVAEEEGGTAYISSGTWGMVGIDRNIPLLTEEARNYNFANEGGAFGAIRFLHNSVNLWLLQRCRRQWCNEGIADDWDSLSAAAAKAEPFIGFIDPQVPEFLVAVDMPATIGEELQKGGYRRPESPAETARVVYESIALKTRLVFDNLCDCLGFVPETLRIVGGGSQDRLLSQFIANALDKRVICGPHNATAFGNILMQMVANGEISSKEEGIAIINNSVPLTVYDPRDREIWMEQYGKYRIRFGGG